MHQITESARETLLVIAGALTEADPKRQEMAKLLGNIVSFGDPAPKHDQACEILHQLVCKLLGSVGAEGGSTVSVSRDACVEALDALYAVADREQVQRWERDPGPGGCSPADHEALSRVAAAVEEPSARPIPMTHRGVYPADVVAAALEGIPRETRDRIDAGEKKGGQNPPVPTTHRPGPPSGSCGDDSKVTLPAVHAVAVACPGCNRKIESGGFCSNLRCGRYRLRPEEA